MKDLVQLQLTDGCTHTGLCMLSHSVEGVCGTIRRLTRRKPAKKWKPTYETVLVFVQYLVYKRFKIIRYKSRYNYAPEVFEWKPVNSVIFVSYLVMEHGEKTRR